MGRYFGTDGFRGEANVKLTADHAFRIGRFLGWYYGEIKKRKGDATPARIVVGKDTRRSGYMLEYSLVGGIVASGAEAHLLHVATTPCVAFSAKKDAFECGVMISASHNAYYDNGIKLLNRDGEKMETEVLDLIEDYLDGSVYAFGDEYKELPLADRDRIGCVIDYAAGRERYMERLISLGVRMDGMKIGLDCANGSAWKMAKIIFEALGAKVDVIHAEPNGMNINDNCGSTHVDSLRKFVLEKKLDVGFAFDGDADRCACVDEKGNILTGDHILYICARYFKEYGELPHNTVVATIMSNFGLLRSLEKIGIECAVTAVGDKYVYECMSKNGYSVGGEQSGHIILSQFATTGDGILTCLKLAEVMKRRKMKMSELLAEFDEYPQALRTLYVTDRDASINDPEIRALVAETEAVLGNNGRILLRASGTESVLRLIIEGDRGDICVDYATRFEKILREKGYLIKVK